MMISFSLEDVSTFNQYKKQFKIVVNQYNKRYQESIKTSPKKYLNTFFMLGIFAKIYLCTIQYIKHILTDNNYARYIKNFDYGKAKMEIDKKINELKKILPFNTTVRIQIAKEKFKKKSHQSNLSDQIYLVNGFKRPLQKEQDVGIYLTNLKGEETPGIFYLKQLKIIKNQTYKKINKIITFLKKKNLIRLDLNQFLFYIISCNLISELILKIYPKLYIKILS